MPPSSVSSPSRADPESAASRSNKRWAIALAGAVSLAVAMGIGRFAFTPLLPMMLSDGVIDLPAASWLASANYLGYLAGALLCTFHPWISARVRWMPSMNAPRMVRGGLVATALLTLAMALPWPATWPLWRFAAGVASAVVFIYTSGWCLAQLARLRASASGGVIYTGPGVGIVISGLAVGPMISWHWSATDGWLIFGTLAFALTATVWRTFRGAAEDGGPPTSGASAASTDASLAGEEARSVRHGGTEIAALTFAYGLAGFGYIITATFLPVIARGALPGSPWLDFFWPIFGCGVVLGALLATKLRVTGDRRRLLAIAYLLQAAGIAASLWSPTLAGFAIGSFVLGLPFTAITFFAMQEVRWLRPASAASTMGLLTAMYGLGQIIGPPLAAQILRLTGSQHTGFALSLEIAASALVLGALIYWWMTKAYRRPAMV